MTASISLKDYAERGLDALRGPPRNDTALNRVQPPPTLARAQVERLADKGMNKTERAYAKHLEAQLRRGEIARWDFEPVTLRLGPDARYTPDFRIILLDGTEVFDDTKALWKGNPAKGTKDQVGWKEDAKVKIRTAAEQHPYIFRGACQVAPGVWKIQTFGRSVSDGTQ